MEIQSAQGVLTVASASGDEAGSSLAMQLDAKTGSASIQLSGTFVGTAAFEASADGRVWTSVLGAPWGTTALAASATAAGGWTFDAAGKAAIRVRCSAYTSGGIAVSIAVSQAVLGIRIMDAPQSLATTSSPTFAAITALTGNTAKTFVYSDASKGVASTAAPTNGQLLIGSTGQVPVVAALTGTAGNLTVTGGAGSITLATPTTTTKYTVTYADTALIAAATTADVSLFTLGQYEKITGVTVKHSVIFSDAGGAMSQVTVSIGDSSSTTAFTAAANVGEATAVADTTFADTDVSKSTTMAAAGRAVLARFTATGANFGTGAATSLVSGSVDIWITKRAIQ